jgi:AAA family ATP:ADP antiporter
MSDGVSTAEFGRLRSFFYPIRGFEAKKAVPMGLLFFCVLLNYTCLRNLKDAIIVTAPNSGAEVISFLKVYCVMPMAIFFMLLYAKGSDMMSNERLFYATVSLFVVFFALFGFVIYPNVNVLHPSPELVASWQNRCNEGFRWPIAIVGNWSYALFYAMSELWGTITMALLFWQFANQICKTSEAKRFYSFFGLLGQFSLFGAERLASWASAISKNVPSGSDPWKAALQLLMGAVVVSGVAAMLIYRWIYKYVLTDKRLYDKQELPGTRKKKAKIGFWQSIKIMVGSPYLGLIAALVICYGISVNVIEGLWKGQVRLMHPDTNGFNVFMGKYVSYTGMASIVMMLLGGNILRTFSWFTAAVITPAMTLVAGSVFFAFVVWRENFVEVLAKIGTNPIVAAAITGAVILVLSKSTKYALFDLTKEMAYIPLDEDMKVKGKAVVEVVGGRLGKASGAWIQSSLLFFIGWLSGRGKEAVLLTDIAPYLFAILVLTSVTWMFAAGALSKKIAAVTSMPRANADGNK